jgi:hypothetical protein
VGRLTQRTAPGGPLIRIKVSPLDLGRAPWSQVGVRRLHGADQGRWEAISRDGFVVICAGDGEPKELVWLLGGRMFPRPAHLIHDDDRDDFRYLDWLLRNYFRIENLSRGEAGPFDDEGVCAKRMQVRFPTFLRGWYPGAEHVLEASSMAADVIAPALRSRWSGR